MSIYQLLSKIEKIDLSNLQSVDWKKSMKATQVLGANTFQKSKLGIKAPSAIVEQEFNFILNPQSTIFNKIKIVSKESIRLEERLKI